jgi:membrane dipeptidase
MPDAVTGAGVGSAQAEAPLAGRTASGHAGLLAVDTHIDIPWPEGPDFFVPGPRHTDLPKLREGGIGAAFLVAYILQRRRDEAGHRAAWERAHDMLVAIGGLGREGAVICHDSRAIRAAHAAGHIAIGPAVENGYAVGEEPGRIAQLRALGATYLTLTHNGHNALADSAMPRADLGDGPAEHGGLSARGREAVAMLNRVGMLADIAHASKAAMMQTVALSASPVVATHSCIRALCDHPRNLDDEQLDALRASGGVVQITAMPSFLKPGGKAESVTLEDFCDHVDYAVRRIGIAHVGVSSDFDGGGGFAGWRHIGESPNVTEALLARG